jgi:hypothetical protein
MTVYYIDHESGNNANNGQSFANRKKTFDSLGTLLANDEIRIIASPDPVSVGSGQWTNGSAAITFASPLPVFSIDDGETLWRAVTNVTPTRSTTAAVEGTYGVSLAAATAFTTGKLGWRRLANFASAAISAARAASLLGVASLTQLVSATADSALQTIALPFSVVYNGVFYDQVQVGSNSWVVFGSGAVASATTTPLLPSIMIGAANNSWQRLYAAAENSGDTFRIRYEGTNATTGTPGAPTIVWEMTFDKNTPGTIKVDIAANTYLGGSTTQGVDGSGGTVLFPMATNSDAGYDITQAITPLDLSAFDTVSFAVGGNTFIKGGSLALCSDVAGDVVVESIPFDANLGGVDTGTGLPISGALTPVVWKKGSALSSSIQSIACYYSVDPGNGSVLFDNVIATTAASGIDHAALIGKKTTDEYWYYHIRSIRANAITIGQHNATASDVVSGQARPYYGTSEAVTTYLQPTGFIPYLTANRVLAGNAALAAISGGWNRTDMSTRTGKSYLRCFGSTVNSYINAGSRVITYVAGIATISNATTMIASATVLTAEDVDLISHTGGNDMLFLTGASFTAQSNWKVKSLVQSTQWTLTPTTPGIMGDLEIDTIINATTTGAAFRATLGSPLNRGSRRSRPIKINRVLNSWSYGIAPPSGNDIRYKGITFGGNRLGDVQVASDGNLELLESTTPTVVHTVATATGMVHTKDGFWVYGGSGAIQGTVVHASATSLRMSPNLSAITALRPLMFQVADISVSAGIPITVKSWARKDNAGLTMGMMIPGGIISGIETDQSATVSAANTWEELSITVTPTVDGILEVWAYCYGGTTFNGYIGELSWET